MLKRNSHIKKIAFKTYLFISNLIWNFLFLFKKNCTNSIYLKRFPINYLSLFDKTYTLILSNDCGGGSQSHLNVLIEENKPHNYILKYNFQKGYFYLYKKQNTCHSERSEESKVYCFKKFVRFFAPLRMTNKNTCNAERSEESKIKFFKKLVRFFAPLRMTPKNSCNAERSEESKVYCFKKFVRFFAPLRMTNKNTCNAERSEESKFYFSKYFNQRKFRKLFENAEQIIINNIAFFPKPLRIIEQIVKQKKENQKVIFVVNDYFSICPSFFLLNYAGKYCGIPEIEVCMKCIKKNNLDYIVNVERDIEKWRNVWLNFLMECDEIRVFSESSVELMKKAYPSISNKILKVKPNYSSLFQNS